MTNQSLFDALGFYWDRTQVPTTLPSYSRERVCFQFMRALPQYVWDAAALENNPYSFIEVKTLLDGVTVGGHKLSDQDQILNLAESSKLLISMVKEERFLLTKNISDKLHQVLAKEEALEWGHFRGEGDEVYYTPDVHLGEAGRFTPVETEQGALKLNIIYSNGLKQLLTLPVFERAIAYFLFGALQQFYFDGNKRTSRLMMNGELISNDMNGISISALKKIEFNEKMKDFYLSKDGTAMMDFMIRCSPDFEVIKKLNSDINWD